MEPRFQKGDTLNRRRKLCYSDLKKKCIKQPKKYKNKIMITKENERQ